MTDALTDTWHELDSSIDDLVKLVLIQQLLNPDYSESEGPSQEEPSETEKIKKEVLALLSGD